MMNRIFLLLQLLIFTSALQAQTYTVYSTIGTTRIVEGKKSVPLTPRKQINTKMRLYIGAESAVTVLDEKNNKMYSFSTEGTFLVGQLVSKASNKGRSISKQYMSYLVKQLFSEGSQKMTHPDTYMQVTATSYRSASSDSMLIRRIVESLPQAEGLTTEQLLYRRGTLCERAEHRPAGQQIPDTTGRRGSHLRSPAGATDEYRFLQV